MQHDHMPDLFHQGSTILLCLVGLRFPKWLNVLLENLLSSVNMLPGENRLSHWEHSLDKEVNFKDF